MKPTWFILLMPLMAQADPWLVCAPYPATAVQPTEFVVTISGIPAPILSPAVAVTGGVALKLDLGPLNLSGTKTFTAKARNAWGESVASLPFVSVTGVPTAPSGLGLLAQ